MRLQHADAPPPGSDPVLAHLTGAGVEIGDSRILQDVDLTVVAGDVVLVSGPNGAGKSTLLRLLAGEVAASHGTVTTRPGLRAALLGDAPVLYDVLTVTEHVEFFARFWQRRVDAAALLAHLRLDHVARSFGRDLSLGERQRLSLGLLTVGEPELVLMDEPFNGLDGDTAELLRGLITTWAERGGAVVVVAHTVGDMRGVARRRVVVERGTVTADGPAELPDAVGPAGRTRW
ncbi:ABC transporter ATP-binding protein [Oceanitalea stevensii]|uniref:ABC transporter ATP-binding protein n=1 Tax=Oceanitalea stevensii TaxID=2763072 RepID=A0ABR8Z2Y9_9MICO|nr:ATP-binding cassette domain-containing protein [Oceanitalea stevensii]MBD8062625.1 ABC transporter ATP-binding protein [Oceanitalea stevensii]